MGKPYMPLVRFHPKTAQEREMYWSQDPVDWLVLADYVEERWPDDVDLGMVVTWLRVWAQVARSVDHLMDTPGARVELSSQRMLQLRCYRFVRPGTTTGHHVVQANYRPSQTEGYEQYIRLWPSRVRHEILIFNRTGRWPQHGMPFTVVKDVWYGRTPSGQRRYRRTKLMEMADYLYHSGYVPKPEDIIRLASEYTEEARVRKLLTVRVVEPASNGATVA